MNKNFICMLLCIFLCTSQAWAQPKRTLYYEKDYQSAWCNLHCGQQEVILADKARIDCLTQTHAIEFDFAKKWAESIGQALYYGAATNKKAGVVLIIEDYNRDLKYLKRLQTVASRYGITVWTMYPKDVEIMKIANTKKGT